jgi:ketoreductase
MSEARRTAFVTGFTSGIGLAVAELLGKQGVAVFGVARNADNVSETVKQLRDAGVEVDGTVCDVRDDESVKAAVQAAVDRYGPIDILVNNAGISGGGATATLSDEAWDRVIDTNLNGTFRVTRAVLSIGGLLAKASGGAGGRVVNIASTAGKQGIALGAPYVTSKHGVVGFSKSLGLELAQKNVTVNAVCPGYVETPLAVGVRQNYAAHYSTTEDAILEKFNAKIPLGRYSTPEEVAGLVGYLCSETAASITAQALNVCGGLGNY